MPTLFERAFFASGIIFAAQQIFGAALPCDQWSGTASSAKERTEVIISLCKDGAKLSLPRVGVQDWPALTRTANGDQIQLVFPSDSGAQRMQLMIADDKIQGTWSDPRFVDDAVLAMTKTTARPAFQEQSVLITGAAGKIGASLIIPDGGGPFPGVVFLHGSGPQLRDASRFQAQALANRGVASLIYDKRGVGQSNRCKDEVPHSQTWRQTPYLPRSFCRRKKTSRASAFTATAKVVGLHRWQQAVGRLRHSSLPVQDR